MNIQTAIEQIDRQVVNQIEDGDKIRWLTDLDRTIYATILSKANADISAPAFNEYDLDTELLVKAPYDEVYRWYLEMQIHGINGEAGRYNIAASKYNSALIAFGDYVQRECGTKTATRIRWW